MLEDDIYNLDIFPYNMMYQTVSSGVGGGEVVEADWTTYNATNDKTPVEFSSSNVNFVKTVNIDSTRVLVVYSGASVYCRARIGTISDSGVISFGTEAVILSAAISDCAVDLLDSTHAIIVVESGGDVKTIAIEFSTSTIDTVGTAVSTQTINSNHLEVAAISSTEFFVAYSQTGANTNRCYYASVSGTTITMGSGITFVSASIQDMDICKLSSATALISYGRTGLFDWSAVLITKSGTAPTVTDTHSISSGSFAYASRSVRRLSDTTAIAMVTDTSANNIKGCIITNTSGTLSNGTLETVDNVEAEYCSISLPASDLSNAVFTYGVNETSMKTTVVSISGTSLTALTNYTNDSADREFIHASEVGTNYVAVGYRDEDDSEKGKVKVLTV